VKPQAAQDVAAVLRAVSSITGKNGHIRVNPQPPRRIKRWKPESHDGQMFDRGAANNNRSISISAWRLPAGGSEDGPIEQPQQGRKRIIARSCTCW
jgi:hypothetical protein